MLTKKARGFVPGPFCCPAHKYALKIRPWTGTHPGRVIVTSNLPFSQWASAFYGDTTLTAALLERLLHHAHIVQIRSDHGQALLIVRSQTFSDSMQ